MACVFGTIKIVAHTVLAQLAKQAKREHTTFSSIHIGLMCTQSKAPTIQSVEHIKSTHLQVRAVLSD